MKGVTVYGTYANIMKYIKSWDSAPRLVRIDSLNVKGESPYVTCTMDLTVFIFMRKAEPSERAVLVEPYLAGEGGGSFGAGGSAVGGMPGGGMTGQIGGAGNGGAPPPTGVSGETNSAINPGGG
jgi:hypothetical protein